MARAAFLFQRVQEARRAIVNTLRRTNRLSALFLLYDLGNSHLGRLVVPGSRNLGIADTKSGRLARLKRFIAKAFSIHVFILTFGINSLDRLLLFINLDRVVVLENLRDRFAHMLPPAP